MGYGLLIGGLLMEITAALFLMPCLCLFFQKQT
jgi:hypothetical protein